MNISSGRDSSTGPSPPPSGSNERGAPEAVGAAPQEPAFGATGTRGGALRIAALLALVVASFALVNTGPFRDHLGSTHEVALWLSRLGWAGPVAFVLAAAAVVALGASRLLVCAAAGLAFGFGWGLLWAQIGTTLGSYATFVIVRRVGREAVYQRWPWLERYGVVLSRGGVLAVMLARQLPLTALCVNSLLALSRVSHAHFLVGTLIGTLTQAIPATLVGASGAQPTSAAALVYAAVAFVLLGAVGWVVRRWLLPRAPTRAT